MHFAPSSSLLLLFNCHENMLWLTCFCWIKYILPIPTYHLRVLSCLVFFHLYKSLLCSVFLIPRYVTNLQATPDTSTALDPVPPSATTSSGPSAAASLAPGPVTHCLAMTALLQPPRPTCHLFTTSSHTAVSYGRERNNGKRKKKRKLKFI